MRFETRHGDGPLRNSVDFAVEAAKRRSNERPPLKAGCVAERRHLNVDLGSCPRERRQARGDRHGSDILGAHLRTLNADTEPLQHAFQRFLREGGVTDPVAGSGEADHKPVADELVGAHILDIDDVLDPRRGERCLRESERSQSDEHAGKAQ